MINTQCAICKERQNLTILYPATFNVKKLNSKIFSARRTPDKMHYKFVKCQRCGLIFSHPILPPAKIFSLYKNSRFDYYIESNYLKETYGKYLEKILKSIKNKKLKLLDIGCGNGFFLEKAKDLGIDEVYGIEPGKPSVEKARKDIRKNIKIDILRPGIFPKNSFDIITCFHTLDHIIDPAAFLKEIHTLLKKKGKAYIIVHNTDGLSVKLFGEKSPIFDIEHIYLFNKKTLRKLFSQNKFRVKEVFTVKNTYPLSYWFRLIPSPSFLKTAILSTLHNTKLSNIPISISAGNIGIIAEK